MTTFIITNKKTGKEIQVYEGVPDDRIDECIIMCKIECVINGRPKTMTQESMDRCQEKFDAKYNLEIK